MKLHRQPCIKTICRDCQYHNAAGKTVDGKRGSYEDNRTHHLSFPLGPGVVFTFEKHRVKLIELMDNAMELFEKDERYRNFHLDGQTIVLDDYLEIRRRTGKN